MNGVTAFVKQLLHVEQVNLGLIVYAISTPFLWIAARAISIYAVKETFSMIPTLIDMLRMI